MFSVVIILSNKSSSRSGNIDGSSVVVNKSKDLRVVGSKTNSADSTFLLGLSPGLISFLANCSRLPLISSKTLLLNGNRR